MKPGHHNPTRWLPVLALMLLGAALRILRIEAQPLSGDEAYSVVIWIQTSLDYLIGSIALATTEPHPPLALITLHEWARLAGDSILSVRLFAVMGSLIALAAAYRIGLMLGGRRAGLIALGLAAISPFHIWYGQFARNYSLWMAGSALSMMFLLHGWRRPVRIRGWIPYVVTAILTGYVFYLEAFHWAAHNLYALTQVWKRRAWVKVWALTQMVIAAALAPWYLRPELFANSRDYAPNGGPANPLWGLQSLLVGNTLPAWLQHPEAVDPAHSLGIASALALLIVAISLIVIWRAHPRRVFWFLLFTGLVPITGLSLLTVVTGRHYFHPRYIAASATPVMLIVALGIDGMLRVGLKHESHERAKGAKGDRLFRGFAFQRDGRRSGGMGAAGVMAGIVLALSGIGLWNYWFNTDFMKGPDWIGVMQVLSDETTPRDVIMMNYPDPAFSYYFEHDYRGPITQPQFMPLAANEPYEDIAREMAAVTEGADSVWFIPVPIDWWDGDQQVARWLHEEKQYVSDRWIGVTRLYQYAEWTAGEDEIAVPVSVEFNGVAALRGYRLTPSADQWQPGSTVHVELFWLPSQQTNIDLKVYVHLLGDPKPDGSIVWAQEDKFPQYSRALTTAWEPGVLIRDVHHLALPPDMPPGAYTVSVGFYDPATGERIPTAGRDAAPLLTVDLP